MSGSFRNPLMLFLWETVSSTLVLKKKNIWETYSGCVFYDITPGFFLCALMSSRTNKQVTSLETDVIERNVGRPPTSAESVVSSCLWRWAENQNCFFVTVCVMFSRAAVGRGVGCPDQEAGWPHDDRIHRSVLQGYSEGPDNRSRLLSLKPRVMVFAAGPLSSSDAYLPTISPVVYRVLDSNPKVTKVLYNKIKNRTYQDIQ